MWNEPLARFACDLFFFSLQRVFFWVSPFQVDAALQEAAREEGIGSAHRELIDDCHKTQESLRCALQDGRLARWILGSRRAEMGVWSKNWGFLPDNWSLVDEGDIYPEGVHHLRHDEVPVVATCLGLGLVWGSYPGCCWVGWTFGGLGWPGAGCAGWFSSGFRVAIGD